MDRQTDIDMIELETIPILVEGNFIIFNILTAAVSMEVMCEANKAERAELNMRWWFWQRHVQFYQQ